MRAGLAIAGLLMMALATPANATESFFCESADGASVSLAVGSVPGFAVVNAGIVAGETTWSMSGEGIPIIVAQAFAEQNRLMVDFADPNVEQILVSVRLFIANLDGEFVGAGTLQTPDSIHAIVCDPEQ